MYESMPGGPTVQTASAMRQVDETGAVIGGAARAAKVAGAQLPAAKAGAISNGQSLSAAIDLAETRLSRIAMPAAWTAAVLTFEVSYDGTNYAPLYDETGTEVAVQAAASRSISLHNLYALFQDVRWLKIRSGTVGAAVNQAADRALPLAVRSI